MTLIMIIAIVVAVLFFIFCVLCLFAIIKSHKDSQESKNRIQNLEKELGAVGELITQKTDRLEMKLDEQLVQTAEAAKAAIAEGTTKAVDEAIDIDEYLRAEEALFDDVSDIENGVKVEEYEDDPELEALLEELERIEREGRQHAAAQQAEAVPQSPQQSVAVPQQATQQPAPQGQITQAEVPMQQVSQQAEAVPQSPQQPIAAPQVAQQPAQQVTQQPARHYQGYDTGKSGKIYTPAELNELIK